MLQVNSKQLQLPPIIRHPYLSACCFSTYRLLCVLLRFECSIFMSPSRARHCDGITEKNLSALHAGCGFLNKVKLLSVVLITAVTQRGLSYETMASER